MAPASRPVHRPAARPIQSAITTPVRTVARAATTRSAVTLGWPATFCAIAKNHFASGGCWKLVRSNGLPALVTASGVPTWPVRYRHAAYA
jgi:hypothetical protein